MMTHAGGYPVGDGILLEKEVLTGAAVAVGIATLGGAVNWLRRKRHKDWGSFAAAILTAAFTGLLSHLLTSWLEMDVHLQYAISGAAGYSGGILLDSAVPMLLGIFRRRVGELPIEHEHEHEHEEAGEK